MDREDDNPSYDYERKYPEDRYGEELSGNARIWRVLLDEAREYDTTVVKSWRKTLDVYLVFTGLFSAVVTTLVVQSSQSLQPTRPESNSALLSEMIAIQRAMANNLPVAPSSNVLQSAATTSNINLWANRFWFLSLALSLFAALMAVLIQQWLQENGSAVSGSTKERALVWQFRRIGLQKWEVPLLVALLPMLLHLSLFVFFIGLILFVRAFDTPMAWVITALTGFFYLLYALSTILPMIYPQCPYRTPASHYGYLLCRAIYNRLRSPSNAQTDDAIINSRVASTRDWKYVSRQRDRMTAESLAWAFETSTNLSVTAIVVQAASGLPPNLETATTFPDPAHPALNRYIQLWFRRTLLTRATVLRWRRGQDHMLERLACSLISFPHANWNRHNDDPEYDFEDRPDFDSNSDEALYRKCVMHLQEALADAIRSKNGDQKNADLPVLEAALLASFSHLPTSAMSMANLFPFLLPDASSGPIAHQNVYCDGSSLGGPNPPAESLRLHSAVWHHMLRYLAEGTHVASRSSLHFALCLWRSMDPSAPIRFGDNRRAKSTVSLRWLCTAEGQGRTRRLAQRAIQRLVCLQHESCDGHQVTVEGDGSDDKMAWLHMLRHAIDLYDTQDAPTQLFNVLPDVREDNVRFLAGNFVYFLQPSVALEYIETATKIIQRPGVTVDHHIGLASHYCRALHSDRTDMILTVAHVMPLFRLLLITLRSTLTEAQQNCTVHLEIVRAIARLFALYPNEVFSTIVEDKLNPLAILKPLAAVSVRHRLSGSLSTDIAAVIGRYICHAVQRLRDQLQPAVLTGEQSVGIAQDVMGRLEYFTWSTWIAVLCATHIGQPRAGLDAPNPLHEALGTLASYMSPLAREAWIRSITEYLQTPLPFVLGMALREQWGRRTFGEIMMAMRGIQQGPTTPETVAEQYLRGAHVRVVNDELWRLCISDQQQNVGERVPIATLVTIQEYNDRYREAVRKQRMEQEQGGNGDARDVEFYYRLKRLCVSVFNVVGRAFGRAGNDVADPPV